jgi:protein-L-isoaspartate O-methyltransferase
MSAKALASKIYSEFECKPESQHIASEFALIALADLVEKIKPKRVLEIGAGIGTITKLLLQHPDRPAQLTVTEAHPVCLAELAKNLKGVDLMGYQLLQSSLELDTTAEFDLVIFDGTLDDQKQYQIFKAGAWCFVEGGRSKTIEALKVSLLKRNLGISFENRRPGGTKLKLGSIRTILGMRLPALRRKPIKGCSFGQVFSQPALA